MGIQLTPYKSQMHSMIRVRCTIQCITQPLKLKYKAVKPLKFNLTMNTTSLVGKLVIHSIRFILLSTNCHIKPSTTLKQGETIDQLSSLQEPSLMVRYR